MNNSFEVDPYPGNPKILFIGLGVSTHTHSWINLLSGAKLNIRLFSVPGGGVPPSEWRIPTYVCDPSLPEGLDLSNRHSLYPLPEEIVRFDNELEKMKVELEKRHLTLQGNIIFKFPLFVKNTINLVGTRLGHPFLFYDYSKYRDLEAPKPCTPKDASPAEWLAKIVQSWQPDIIHTLGMFDGQGGDFYYHVRKRFELESVGTWILQLRGGSDIALRRYNEKTEKQFLELFDDCSQIITDNYFNIEYLKKLGFGNKVASISPVPGTGGVEVDSNLQNITLPSKRKRIIFWPKAYESMWSKSLPVIEAIRLIWDQIKPCTIYATATDEQTQAWFLTLPAEIRENFEIHFRIPRPQVLEMMKQARVVLAPSLVDGVPNVLYEAMANGALPIISPLNTIMPIVSEPQNTIFARNLYIQEIADAVVKAMTDDDLIDNAAKNNHILVNKLASRRMISNRVIDYYFHVAGTINL